MKLERCSLNDMAERLGGNATADEAEAMARILLDAGYQTTESVPDHVWTETMAQAIEYAREQRNWNAHSVHGNTP